MPAARLKQTLARYGKTALYFHSSVWISTWSCTYLALRTGVDVQALLASLPASLTSLGESITGPGSGGETAALVTTSYLLTATTGPARGVLTVAATPLIAKKLGTKQASAGGDPCPAGGPRFAAIRWVLAKINNFNTSIPLSRY